MTIAPLQIMLLGFDDEQHKLVLKELLSTGIPATLNLLGLDQDEGQPKLSNEATDVVFLYRKSIEQPLPLFRYLHKHNPDCIVVEVLPPHASHSISSQNLLQSCRVIYAPEREEFQLALQFVLQYGVLKRDFRQCKSLLHLSEQRVLKLVNASTQAVAYLSKGKFIHANIAFLALFAADSTSELARFPLIKLIDEDERSLLAGYFAMANKNGGDIDLTLSMKKLSGVPFVARITVAPVVYKGERCYQLWVTPTKLSSQPVAIPVAQALNVWELPSVATADVTQNPFDKVVGLSGKGGSEKRIDVLLKGVQQADIATLSLKEIYDVEKGPLNSFWVTLDVKPDEFKEVNLLLNRMDRSAKTENSSGSFWDQLFFRLVFDALMHERQSRRAYYIKLTISAVKDDELMKQLVSLITALESKSKQLKIVFDATVSLEMIPTLAKAAESLRALNCGIVLDKFSVDTTPLYLYRKLQPDGVFFDKHWLEALKEKQDGQVFLSRFVQQLERNDVDVVMPQVLQSRQDRLLVLTAASFGQESTANDYASFVK